MKFAKELEQDLVPEWRAKYLDYKEGKKYVKAISRAISRANGSPRLLRRDTFLPRPHNNSPLSRTYAGTGEIAPVEPLRESPAPLGVDSRPESEDSSGDQKATTPMLMPSRRKAKADDIEYLRYGSIVATPPSSSKLVQPLELPGPALSSDSDNQYSPNTVDPSGAHQHSEIDAVRPVRSSSNGTSSSAYEVGQTTTPRHKSSTFGPASNRSTARRPRLMSLPDGPAEASPQAFFQRMFSVSYSRDNPQRVDVSLPAFDQVRARQQDFFKWMDGELDKIENFYKSKEDEAGDRLNTIREQLHMMRNRRIDEIAESRKAKDIRKNDEHAAIDSLNRKMHSSEYNRIGTRGQLQAWMQPIEKAIQNAKMRTRGPQPGPNSRALQNMERTPELLSNVGQSNHRQIEDGRDYVRRPHHDPEIPYRSAKRKLKLALKEYYRGLELLKSYALLNRTAFRKINKKYDKAVNARPPLRYMSEKVNKAWFVQSDVLDGYIHAVEDLYSRYFERGNHKVAVGKLRSSTGRPGEYTGSAFRSGLLIGTGAVFAIQGLIYASDLLYYEPDEIIQLQTSYLLQIYGGYFLALYLFIWFCLDCCIWSRNKINYIFIFEFDPRNHLDWRELVEFPSFLLLALGLFMWLNFSRYGSPEMFIYYPVVLIFVTVLIIFLPAPVLFHRSRRWFVYSHWRLLLAGLYPVEFRDFFLGDMYGSLTYFTANIELFFCLYANHWINPPQCNSTHSRLLGFFSTLPGIWRALQCVRRYWDTGNVFPHLVNCGKYGMTILYYVSLSLYRIEDNRSLLALFITFATINALYTSVWDLAMDWSLCQPDAEKRFLRNVRGYKPTWPYYLAMLIDPPLRFNWVFYVIYTHDLQHSSIASFLIAFSEVSRRGMWTLFRVENEHAANVAHFKAFRDIPLPYPLSPAEADTFARKRTGSESPELEATATQSSPTSSRHRSRTTAAEEGQGVAGPSGGLRRRAPTRTFTSLFADAHTQDFEKKRKPGAGDSDNVNNMRRDRNELDDDGRVASSDDDDDEEDALHLLNMEEVERRKGREDN